MNALKKSSVLALTAILAFGGVQIIEQFELDTRFGVSALPSFVATAEAKVGRPLTPVSVGGVARRTSRRN